MPLWILTTVLATAFGAGLLSLRALLWIVEVEGESMVPALRDGDRVLVLRRLPARWLRRGWIVIVTPPHVSPDVRFVKRLVGLPGDRLSSRLDELHEAVRTDHAPFYDRDGVRRWRVPPGHVFVRGDSRGSDSRAWGPIPSGTVAGVVVRRLPPRRPAPAARRLHGAAGGGPS